MVTVFNCHLISHEVHMQWTMPSDFPALVMEVGLIYWRPFL